MEVFEAVRTLLAVRQYQDRLVPAELVFRVVEAAHLTASAANQQPWHFVVVQDRDTLKRIGELVQSGPYIAQAAFAVVVATDKTSQFGVSDASRAIQNMMLVAWAEGLGSNWAGFRRLADVGALLRILARLEVLAVVPFGYPAQTLGRGKKDRKQLSEVVSREQFGQPFG